jgi:hypothetical protein
MTGTAEKQHALVAAFSASLSVRPDSERVRAILADEFIAWFGVAAQQLLHGEAATALDG